MSNEERKEITLLKGRIIYPTSASLARFIVVACLLLIVLIWSIVIGTPWIALLFTSLANLALLPFLYRSYRKKRDRLLFRAIWVGAICSLLGLAIAWVELSSML